MIKSINFHELEPQKYWTFPASQGKNVRTEARNMIFSNNYIGSRKMDGAFYKFIKNSDGSMELLGRSKGVGGDYLDKLDHVPQLMDFFNSLPCGTCLLGELYFPDNEGSNNVTKIMGCLTDKAIKRQAEGNKLHYYVFDVLAYNSEILYTQNIEDRVFKLNQLSKTFIKAPYVEFAVYAKGQVLWDMLDDILAEGGEGIVITKIGTPYQPGKRPARQTLKIKKEVSDTIDVVIMGANPPTKEYGGKEIETWKYWFDTLDNKFFEGELYNDYFNGKPIIPVTKAYFHRWAGSLAIGVVKNDKVVQIGSLSGLTEEVLENWQNYVGKVAEISCMEVLETGGLRHPRFIQWRNDLTPKDCTWEKIYGDK